MPALGGRLLRTSTRERVGVLHFFFGTRYNLCPVGEELATVAAALNSRPRKTLGWLTPAEAIDNQLMSTRKTTVATIS